MACWMRKPVARPDGAATGWRVNACVAILCVALLAPTTLASCAHGPREPSGGRTSAVGSNARPMRQVGDCRFVDVGGGITRIEPVPGGGPATRSAAWSKGRASHLASDNQPVHSSRAAHRGERFRRLRPPRRGAVRDRRGRTHGAEERGDPLGRESGRSAVAAHQRLRLVASVARAAPGDSVCHATVTRTTRGCAVSFGATFRSTSSAGTITEFTDAASHSRSAIVVLTSYVIARAPPPARSHSSLRADRRRFGVSRVDDAPRRGPSAPQPAADARCARRATATPPSCARPTITKTAP